MTNTPEKETPPFLHGDGETDDTDAFQWYIDHGVAIPESSEYRVRVADLRLPPGSILSARRP